MSCETATLEDRFAKAMVNSPKADSHRTHLVITLGSPPAVAAALALPGSPPAVFIDPRVVISNAMHGKARAREGKLF